MNSAGMRAARFAFGGLCYFSFLWTASAGHHGCDVCGCACCPQEMVQRTIMVPMCVTETRTKPCVVKTMKEREETYTVFKRVPEKREYSRECCYMDVEVRSKEITQEKCRRVTLPATLEDTIHLPVHEIHHGVKRREICTLCGKKCIEEPCTCCVTRTVEAPRVQNCTRQDVVFEECRKTIDYCVKVPKFEKIDCGVETVYKLVPVEKKRTVQVCVPEIVHKPVEVKVTRMVAKTICCCPECWCEIEKQGGCSRKQGHGKHQGSKTHKLLAKVPNPVEFCAMAVEAGVEASDKALDSIRRF